MENRPINKHSTLTATKQFKILEVLEPVLDKEKASEFTERIEEIVDAKIQNEARILATKEDLYKLSKRLESRIWTTLITLFVMILGLYATIIFKH